LDLTPAGEPTHRTAANDRRRVGAAALLLVFAMGVPARANDDNLVELVWHVESPAGEVVDSRSGDTAINPASVLKVATSLWALDRLGPDHRFETRFAVRGALDPAAGVLDGDLLVFGASDPDFHVENAFRVAQALNRLGLHTVRGKLLVDERFWIGWEGGSEAKRTGHRAQTMATRLRDALDPERWDRSTRRLMQEFTRRNAIDGAPPRVVIEGGVGTHSEADALPLVAHRSNPLKRTLKRLNAYSNNDIERLGASLGTADDLLQELSRYLGGDSAGLRVATLSGLGSNRMTPRQVVKLLGKLDEVCRAHEMRLQDILPMVGCDPGTLEQFPELTKRANRGLVAKTGTLVRTDGGVAVLAGVAHSDRGPLIFCVAAPRSGRKLTEARRSEEQWVLELLARHDRVRPAACGDEVGYSDDDARLVTFGP